MYIKQQHYATLQELYPRANKTLRNLNEMKRKESNDLVNVAKVPFIINLRFWRHSNCYNSGIGLDVQILYASMYSVLYV